MNAPPYCLDASALLALLQGEPGADGVEAILDGAVLSCVNLSEVLQKAEQHDIDTEGLEYDLEALGVELRPFSVSDARATAERWTAGSGLSLGDRACVSLAVTLGGTAVTAERQWLETAADASVRMIR
jgi:PIN domain nuclease of toxin-antitoxin system